MSYITGRVDSNGNIVVSWEWNSKKQQPTKNVKFEKTNLLASIPTEMSDLKVFPIGNYIGEINSETSDSSDGYSIEIGLTGI